MGKTIGLGLLLLLGVILGFPELKQTFDEFSFSGNATRKAGLIASLPAETAFMTFFWDAFPYLLAIIVVAVVIVMIVIRSRGER